MAHKNICLDGALCRAETKFWSYLACRSGRHDFGKFDEGKHQGKPGWGWDWTGSKKEHKGTP